MSKMRYDANMPSKTYDYADERALQLLLGVTQSIEQRAVGGPFDALGDVAAAFFHMNLPPMCPGRARENRFQYRIFIII